MDAEVNEEVARSVVGSVRLCSFSTITFIGGLRVT